AFCMMVLSAELFTFQWPIVTNTKPVTTAPLPETPIVVGVSECLGASCIRIILGAGGAVEGEIKEPVKAGDVNALTISFSSLPRGRSV
ncbi:hypothetical protein chiPu_0025859, partial [Chiloscyllium punctatum]|nr:hypothetical protein [Chiloscyllium punctatum]